MCGLTLTGYLSGLALFRIFRRFSLFHPLVSGSLFIAAILYWQGINFSQYIQSNRLFTMILGPATVALAVPMYQQLPKVRETGLPLAITLLAGAVTVPLCGIVVAVLAGGSPAVASAMLTKAITTPVALGVAEQATGANPGLVAGIVVFCGVVAAVVAQPLFKLLKIDDHRVQGVTMGLNGHAVATARGFEISPVCGAFSSLALAINAIVTALLLPVILAFLN